MELLRKLFGKAGKPKTEEQITAWQARVRTFDEATLTAELREQARRYENEAASLLLQAQAYTTDGRNGDAIKTWQTAADMLTRELEILPINSFSLYNLGICYQKLGQTDNAIDAFHASLLCEPTAPAVEAQLARLYDDMGDIGEAQQHYAAALTLQDNAAHHALIKEDQNHVETHYRYALCLEKSEKWSEAVTSWQNLIGHVPNLPIAHAGLGVALFFENPLTNIYISIAAAKRAMQFDADGSRGVRDIAAEYIKQLNAFQHGGQFTWRKSDGKIVVMQAKS